MSPVVSIIVTNYNYSKYLKDCFASIMLCGYRPIELIVVDDDSTDESVKTINDLHGIYSGGFKKIFLHKNYGVSYARNTGIDGSTGDYIHIMDADDMLLPNGVEKQVDYMERHREISMVYGEAKKINTERKNSEWTYRQVVEEYKANPDKIETYSRPINNGTLLWRRDVYKKYGCYYEKLRSKEDKEFLYRLGIHADSPFGPFVKTKKLKDFIFVYRRHEGSKHKMRIADPSWKKETDEIFNNRINRLIKEGVTKENTRFPVWS